MIRSAALAILVILGAQSAQAAETAPAKAGAFAAWCEGRAAACKAAVVEANLERLAVILNDPQAPAPCMIPKGVETGDGTRQIVAWLGSHREAAGLSTADGIAAAQKAIWTCQAQVGDGVIPGDPPARTAAFLAYCPNHVVKCANKMTEVQLDAYAMTLFDNPAPAACAPPKGSKPLAVNAAVLAWLAQHPETHGMETDAAIQSSFDHLWPCH